MEAMWEAVYTALQRISPIPDEEWAAFRSIAVFTTVAKHNHFVREGEYAETIGLCVSGLFRLYYTTPDGEEYNKNFCSALDFIAPYSSLLQNTPSIFSIQALLDCELIVIRYSEFQSLFTRHICWERLGRKLVEQLFVRKEMRERELLMLSAEERFLLFLERYGHVAGSIPQYHIASYLGITPVALSRIRRKINLG